ncbi:MAG: DUF624 domain-containing protein [Clostridia bacterium]|nr:DUF624 domain-containing protein [Clostridia bacterium]
MEEETKKKKRFKLFDSQREGKGVSKEEANLPPNLKKFFILYKRDFGRLLTVNMFMVLGNFPIFFLALAFSGILSYDFVSPALDAFPVFQALVAQEGLSAPLLALGGIIGVYTPAASFKPIAYVFMGLGLLLFFTWGIVNVGTTYILRNMVKGEPVFMWSDFWYAVKRNFKQAFPFGMLDLLLLGLLPVNVLILSQYSGFLNGILFWMNIFIAIIYITMRFYIYIQMVTFNLSIRKILKNALIFSIVGFKRNFMAFLGICILVFIHLALAYSGIFLGLAIILPLVLLFSNGAYMTTYAAYFKIKELMIDPYQEELSSPEEEH